MLIFAGWVNRSRQDVIEHLQDENGVLHERLGGKRLSLTDGQRPCLAAEAKAIGRKGLFEISTLVTRHLGFGGTGGCSQKSMMSWCFEKGREVS